MDIAWMAWTWQTALFFAAIAAMLVVMSVLSIMRPEMERVGVLGIPTTRGDRLFISLLGTAFINLAWLGFVGHELWWALGFSLAFGIWVFRWV
jgi:predicted small integral membrane protein